LCRVDGSILAMMNFFRCLPGIVGVAGFIGMRIAVDLQQALKALLGPVDTAGAFDEPGIVMQCQDQSIHFIDDLLRIDVGAQVAQFGRLAHAAVQRVLPGHDHPDRRIRQRR